MFTKEHIAEKKTCRLSGQEFFVTEEDLKFYDQISPVFDGKKYTIPSPTLCPDERTRRRMMFRNFIHLYPRKSDLSGKDCISVYHADSPFPVYTTAEWWSDDWSALDYGLEPDFSSPFFDQLKVLHTTVPRFSLHNNQCENSEHSNMAVKCKNCYLVFGSVENEDCRYGHIVWYSRDCTDCLYVYRCENCYQCVDCVDCFGLHYSQDSQNCREGAFLHDCVGCENCFGCVGLRNQKYHIFNQPYSPEQYKKMLAELDLTHPESFEMIQKRIEKFRGQMPVKYMHGHGNENVVGDFIYYSKDVFQGFDVKDSEDLKYCATIGKYTDSQDCNYMSGDSQFLYETITGKGRNIAFSHICINDCSDVYYSDNCSGCQNLFGCFGLKSARNCLLNKQYSVQEYQVLAGKVADHMKSTGEWGEFFPHEFSSFGYNESIAHEYFPLGKEEAEKRGWTWREIKDQEFEGETYEPLHISQYDPKVVGTEKAKENIDACLSGVIRCTQTGKPFKLIQPELAFYIEHHLPISTIHPIERHKNRMKLRNPRKLWTRECSACEKKVQTTYAPERSEQIHCEPCYQKTY